MLEMFKGMVNSPETTITNDINAEDTIIYVLDETKVPEELPNLMTLGTGTSAETVKVLEVNGNALTVERGFQGVARSWNAGTVIARNFTEYDYNALMENIKTLKENTDTNADDILDLMSYVGDLENLDTIEKANLVLALNEIYQELAAHKADYAKEATMFTIESDNIYQRTDCVYYKKNGFVYLSLSSIQKKDATAFEIGEIVATLPVGFRPKQTAHVQGMAQTGAKRNSISLTVYDSGPVQIGETSSDTAIRLSVSYYAGGGTV